ncbi:GDYXXLXY domain-containing protein [Leucothrix mucor]|uniref:GDYXXLXY domain-containing protein n=1 Tax=Leucothrix mucor TaxID=45248 RepID=UPI0003B54B52|nr:GDYXXLXY domain-containing protein [Leucothrix mucor]
MRKLWVILIGLVVLAVVNYSIYSREMLVTKGDSVILQLAPVDPRSLMQGDYMALRFAVASEAQDQILSSKQINGFVILKPDEKGVGRFVRLDDLSALNNGEVRMRYRLRKGQVKFATNAFFFQEGQAKLFEAARFGEFRVNKGGDSVLVEMRDENLQRIGERSLVE